MAEANRVRACLPMLSDALVRGEIDVARARLLIHETDVLTEELAAEVVGELLKVAGCTPWMRLKQLARALVIAADPERAELSARDEARRERSVRRQTLSETMTRLIADLTHAEAALLWDHIDNGARSSLPGETEHCSGEPGYEGGPRTIDAARADALMDLLTEAFTDEGVSNGLCNGVFMNPDSE